MNNQSIGFDALLTYLPDCLGCTALPTKGNPGGFRYTRTGLPEFVAPDVSPSTTIEEQPNSPKIMIVSAAGAVGKSTLANQMAFKKGAPIWDLALASAVGVNSVSGELTASFGFSLAANVSTQLANGQLFLIIDALDEARVKANEAGFEAFVNNIAEIARSVRGVAFVLFARTLTAETTWLLLKLADIPTSMFSIQPFDREQAKEYIKVRIRHLDIASAKRSEEHPQPFVEARDLILDHLELAVGGKSAIKDQAAREFLGYWTRTVPCLYLATQVRGCAGQRTGIHRGLHAA